MEPALKLKPRLSPSMTLTQFDTGYWYAAELKKFAETIGIPSANKLRKDELETAIKHLLKSGKIKSPTKRSLTPSGPRGVELGLKWLRNETTCRRLSSLRHVDRYSAEVLDQHDIADALIRLCIHDRSAIRRNSQSRRSLKRILLHNPNPGHPVRGKTEKVDRCASTRHGRDEIDAFVLHSPITPI